MEVPLCVYVDVTNRCNFTCPWCPTGQGLQRKVSKNLGTMETSLFDKIVADFRSLTQEKGQKVKTFGVFMMGESLLHPDISKMLAIAKKADIADRVILSTNGSLMGKSVAKGLVDSGIDLVSVSMYGLSNQEYAEVSAKTSFDDVLGNCRQLIQLREERQRDLPKVFLKFFENSKALAEKRGFLQGYCDHVAVEEPFNWNEEFTKETGKWIEAAGKQEVRYCSQPWYVMSVAWDGSVLVCCSDWSWTTKVGDANTQSIQEIWQGDAYHKFRKRIVEGKQDNCPACRGCNFYQVNPAEANIIDELIENEPERALRRVGRDA